MAVVALVVFVTVLEKQVDEAIMTYIREHHILTQPAHSSTCDAISEAHGILCHSVHENQMSAESSYSFHEKPDNFAPMNHLT